MFSIDIQKDAPYGEWRTFLAEDYDEAFRIADSETPTGGYYSVFNSRGDSIGSAFI